MSEFRVSGPQTFLAMYLSTWRLTRRSAEKDGRLLRETYLLSQVVFRGVAGDRRHGMSAQDVVFWATSFVPVVVEPAGWLVAITRAMQDPTGSGGHQLLVVLLQQQHPGQPQQRRVVGEDPHHI